MVKLIPFVFFLFISSFSKAQTYISNKNEEPTVNQQLVINKNALNFLVMGDWGRNGADHQKQVAVQMAKTAAVIQSQFTIATGDNFYPSGVISEFDPLFKYSFEDIYTDFSLQWDWYPVLGNHDYKSNPDAEVAYSKISRRWKMPARYYSKKITIKGNKNEVVLLVFIDTNPLIPEFYSNEEYGPQVKTQDSLQQKQWLEKVLGDTASNVKWKIVVGHHPMYSAGGRTEAYDTKAIRNSLQPLFEKYHVDFYLTGHEHSLQYIKPKDHYTHHFISGAASESTPVKKIPGFNFAAAAYGFMVFSVTGQSVVVQTVNDSGKIIYSTTIHK
ncbi:MAG: metallophosphoesterase [Bacteroidota bacterium]|nr:metallophosphoesterase [Bacteroidota bacterium]